MNKGIIKYKNCSKVSLENLYTSRNNNDPHRLKVIFANSVYVYDVILDGRDNKPDCKVTSFSANFFFRTPNGTKSKRYVNLSTLTRAIKETSKRFGLEVEYFEISKGEPAFL